MSRSGESGNLCDAQYAGPHRKTRRLWNSSTAGSLVSSQVCGGRGMLLHLLAVRAKLRTGLEVRPSFSLSLNEKDLRLLEDLQRSSVAAGSGSRREIAPSSTRRGRSEISRTSSCRTLRRFPLRGYKARSCAGFSRVCRMVEQGDHLQRDGLREIVSIAYQMNLGKRRHSQATLLKVLDEVKG